MGILAKLLLGFAIIFFLVPLVCGVKQEYTFELTVEESSESTDYNGLSDFVVQSRQYKPNFAVPSIAFHMLMMLHPPEPENMKKESYLAIKHDPTYCSKVYKHFVNNPGTLFSEMNFMTDYSPYSYFRKTIIPMVGFDLMPHINGKHTPLLWKMKKGFFNLDPYINNIYTKIGIEHGFQLGRHLGCITQNYNHLPGAKQMADKDKVAANLKEYSEKYKSQPACSPGNRFFPQTWLLEVREECIAWFEYINSTEYQTEKAQKKIVFMRKIGAKVHRGMGVAPVDDQEETFLRAVFANGLKCGFVDKNYLVQRYISNPLLVQGHKFDFRVYMMISSTNPLIVYYHDGFLRVSLFEYDINSKEKGVHLTNTAQSEVVFQNETLQQMLGMNETELRNFQMWNYTRLAQYLISVGKIESMSWLDDYLRPKLEHAMQHLVRMTSHHFPKSSNIWELYGVDFMLDDDLNLWFIECNIGPVIKATSEEKGEFLKKMFKDAFEIITAQLRSRMKRVIKFCNQLLLQGFVTANPQNSSDISISNLEVNKRIFDSLLQNSIENEFKINPENSWIKIVDESLEGTSRYNQMFPSECLS